TLVDSKIQIPPRKHTPISPSSLLHMQQTLAKLPSPIPLPPLRRFLLTHVSKHTITRLVEYTDTSAEQLQTLGQEALAELLDPSSLAKEANPGTRLAQVDLIVQAFGVGPESLLQHYAIPHFKDYTTTTTTTSAATESKSTIAWSLKEDELSDFMAAYAGGPDVRLGARFLTRYAEETGGLSWSLWNHLVTRFTSTPGWIDTEAGRDVVSIVIHDLSVRRVEEGGDTVRWFAEKEADEAVAAVMKGVDSKAGKVRVFEATVGEVCGKVLEAVETGAGVPWRFVAVMERVERECVSGEEGRVGKWVDLLTLLVLENPGWQTALSQATLPSADRIPASHRFYYAVVALLEDPVGSTRFATWVQEPITSSSLSSSHLPASTLTASSRPAPTRLSSVTEQIKNTTAATTSSLSTLSSRGAEIGSSIAASHTVRTLSTHSQGVADSVRGHAAVQTVSTKTREAVDAVTQSPTYLSLRGKTVEVGNAVAGGVVSFAGRVRESGAVQRVGEVVRDVGGRTSGMVGDGVASVFAAVGGVGAGGVVVVEEKGGKGVKEGPWQGKEVGSVEMIDGKGEKQKQAWDSAWDRLSGRLSTVKK
ncbi:hypothetical protein HDU98_009576, partial [Podochytrium sp. JEL0797]